MKKIISFLLSAIIVLQLFSTVTFAEDSVNVFVTIYDKDGKIVVSQESISVTDQYSDGKLTICDALIETHREKFYGPDGFVMSQGSYGLQIDILWGNHNGGSYGYYLNDASAYSLLDEVKDGDYLNAYSYTDLTAWSDKYTYFDKRMVSAKENEEVTLTLSYAGYDENWAPISLPLADADITVNGDKINVKTDADGKATFKIEAEGEYVVSAVSEDVIVAPICKVSVEKAETKNVFVTISDKDGKIAVAQEDITVTDLDGDEKITICDTLIAVHNEKYEGENGFAYSQGSYGLQIDTLWGNTNGGSYGYYLNDASAMGLTTEVKDGDYLNAYSYTDLTSWSDKYTYFDKRTVSVKENEDVTLTLSYAGYDENWNPVSLPLADADITVNGDKINVKTDAEGKATFKIETEGEYTVSAVSESVIVAPICQVTVSADSEGGSGGVNPGGGSGGGGSVIPSTADPEKILDKIIEYNLEMEDVRNEQAWIDEALTHYAGTTAEWYILGLSQYKRYDFEEYERALVRYVRDKEITSDSSKLKYALILAAIGSTDDYIEETLRDSTGEQGIMSYVYGLHLLNNGYERGSHTVKSVTKKILGYQLADGGWSVSGESGDVDVTAMVIQSLAPQYRTNIDVKEAVDNALALISERQKSNGEFANYGIENPETTAQVIVALSSLGIDCETDRRFIKGSKTLLKVISGYQLKDGSICHTKDADTSEVATNQVFYAMVAYLRMLEGREPLYILDYCELPDDNYDQDYGGGSGSSGGGTAETTSKTDTESEEITAETVKDGWEQLSDGSWIYRKDSKTVSNWQFIGNVWYYFDKSVMQTGWQKVNNTWYYLKSWGGMATGWTLVNNTWYYLKSWGGMATGWLLDNGNWYYLKDSGAMAKGWIEVKGKWYYLYDSGKMAANTMVGKYRVNSNGEWIK